MARSYYLSLPKCFKSRYKCLLSKEQRGGVRLGGGGLFWPHFSPEAGRLKTCLYLTEGPTGRKNGFAQIC